MKAVKIIIAVVVVFLLFAWAVGSYLGVNDLKHCDAAPSSKKGCQAADAIVAVSGGDTLARAQEAITLYKNGWSQVLIFSGAAADKSGPSNARVMQQQAIDEGVDPNAIIIEEVSETTSQNAEETSSIFEKYGIKSAIIVTSAYHERRAMLEFGKRAPAIDLRGHPVATDKQWGRFWWLTPVGWSLAMPELVHSFILSVNGVDRE